jgi:hypothetical protein
MRVSDSAGTIALMVKAPRLKNTLDAKLHEPFLPRSTQLRVPCLPPDVWLQCTVAIVFFHSVRPSPVVWKALF